MNTALRISVVSVTLLVLFGYRSLAPDLVGGLLVAAAVITRRVVVDNRQ
jgi:hypothetical protein